ncbi:hypothetical protein AB0H88_19495 [Nonomuraea sp. NPDC050680]|uniref:hypothetical protein n=1 Tax=Nonomuraea sp. NPDC050680 TaxID=3154630 RepID=UPI0033EC0215
MTDQLESHLRSTLGHAAEHAPKAPSGLRAEVVSRSRRRRTRSQAIVVALAVTAVALPVTLTATGGQQGDVVAIGTINPGHRIPSAMDGKTPLGERLVIDNPSEERPLTLWYAKGKTGTVLCQIYESRNGVMMERCGKPLDDRKVTEQGSTESFPAPSTGVTLYFGTARAEVARVTAVIEGGGEATGLMYRPKGAPQGIWTVSAPSGQRVTAFEFADAQGRTVSRLKRNPTSFAKAVGEPVGPAVQMPGGLSVDLYKKTPSKLLWKLNGLAIVMHFVEPDRLLTDLDGKKYPVELAEHDKRWLGIASAKTARVTLLFGDGRSVSAVTRPDPWNLGIRLFAGTYDRARNISYERFQIIGYDEAGVQIWQQTHEKR